MKKSLTVFVCSTFSDLKTERESVLEAIRKLQHQHDSMEFFGARNDLPIETCLEEVSRSDLLVVIVGYRYGNLVPDTNISFSEAEYQEGFRLGKPCLVYFRDENVPILPKFVENNPEKIKFLDNFKNKLKKRHTIATFKNAHDLSVSVAADLSRTAQALIETAKYAYEQQKNSISPIQEINNIIENVLKSGIDENSILSTIRAAVSSLMSLKKVRRPLVYFSYSHLDRNLVRNVASQLKKKGN